MKHSWLVARLITLTRVYLTFLFVWAILHAAFGDRWAWLFLFNTFAGYLFVPLIAVFVIALATHQRELWIGLAIAVALVAFLYGGLFLPKPTNTNSATLTVMSFNMLGFSTHPDTTVTALRSANTDAIAIQELNPPVADAIRRDLAHDYPYQVLDPQEGVIGLGIISRYPLSATGDTLPGNWLGTPQVLTLDWNGKPVTILHVHTFPTSFAPRDFFLHGTVVETSIRQREQQSRAVADFAATHRNTPLIVTGDFNMTDQNTAYAIVANTLTDSWREAGWGLGHTFPSTNFNGQPMPPLFQWLLRIDYIFHSRHWQAVSAELGPWDGYSDHRSVIVKLTLEAQ